MDNQSSHKSKEGFTLLELLIVIGILAILGAVVILVLNPAETLRETRDSQRISDLSTAKTAIGLYLTSTTSPSLGGAGVSDNTACKSGPTDIYAAGDKIFYSVSLSGGGSASITDTTLDNSTVDVPVASQTPTVSLRRVDGGGWLPVFLTSLTSGSPLDAWPIDPTNTISSVGAVANSDAVYRYACAASPLTFELNARLEAVKSSSTMVNDGGNNPSLYEVGTDTRILTCRANEC